jgi:hypothetical protein
MSPGFPFWFRRRDGGYKILQPTHSGTPDLQTLTAVLRSLLIENGPCKGELSIVHREPTCQGTFPKEVVTCSLGDGRELRLFCKYEMGYNHNAFGHRGGVAHEATVYQELLHPLALSTPWLYGVYEDASSGEVWLVLDFLERSVRVKKSLDPAAMGLAAHWIGQFHAATEVRLQKARIPFLKTYDAAYYLGWSQRTLHYAGCLRQRFLWLEPLCERFEEAVTTLLFAPETVIHGEYYPKNILFRDGKIYPIDWESTAIAAGEIDLASLIEGWPEEIAHQCRLQYQQARWPTGSPGDFERTLCAAQMYLHFRWLGDQPETTINEWRFEQLHSTGKRLGLV